MTTIRVGARYTAYDNMENARPIAVGSTSNQKVHICRWFFFGIRAKAMELAAIVIKTVR